jgi:hypothetical protein
MNTRIEAMMSILAALLVLFSAMLDPRISVALAVIFMVAFALYRLTHHEGEQSV